MGMNVKNNRNIAQRKNKKTRTQWALVIEIEKKLKMKLTFDNT